MFSRGKFKGEMTIPVSLEEPLTSDSCAKIITELMKYILHQKQQIPFSCDSLVQLQKRFKPTDRNYSSTKAVLNTLDNISEQLTSQLHLAGCNVKEVVIMIGATTISPKFCLKLELPENILSSKAHVDYQHSYRKPLLTLMRSVIECPEFQEAMTVPLGPTNTFVLVQKSDSNPKSDFFLPKPQYAPSPHTTCFSVKLYHNEEIIGNCPCSRLIKVHQDGKSDNPEEIAVSERCSDAPYIWYQSKEVVKGFKYQR